MRPLPAWRRSGGCSTSRSRRVCRAAARRATRSAPAASPLIARPVDCPPARRWGSRRVRRSPAPARVVRAVHAADPRALHALKYAGERRLAEPLGDGRRGTLAARRRRGRRPRPRPGPRGPAPGARLRPGRADRRGRRRRARPAVGRRARAHPRDHRAVPTSTDGIAPTTCAEPSRRRHAHGAAVRGRWVVLVDDVVTTGATLSRGRTALLDAGATRSAPSRWPASDERGSAAGTRPRPPDARRPPGLYSDRPEGPSARPRRRTEAPGGAGRSAVRTIVRGKNLEVPDRVRRVRGAQVRPPRAPPRRSNGRHRRALERGPPQLRRTPTSRTSRS